MFCGVKIRYLVLTMILYNQQLLVTSDDSQKKIKIMNMLLKYPGWGQFYGIAAKQEYDSFTGLDLFLTCSDDTNVDETYRKTVHLLACAYANNLLHFIRMLQHITLQTTRVGYKMKKRIQEQKRYRGHFPGKIFPNDVSSMDYTEQWKLFNLAVGVNRKSVNMFSFMLDAMLFLLNLVPLGYFNHSLNLVLHTARSLQNFAFNTNYTLPEYREGYINKDDNTVLKLNRRLNDLLDRLVKCSLERFTDDFCILSDEVKVYLPDRKASVDYYIPAAEMKIESLVNEVVNNYDECGFSRVQEIYMNINESDLERGIEPDLAPDIDPGVNPGIEPGIEPDVGPGIEPDMNQNIKAKQDDIIIID